MSKITDPVVLDAIDFINRHYEALGSLAPQAHSREEQHAISVLAAYIRSRPLPDAGGVVEALGAAERVLAKFNGAVCGNEQLRDGGEFYRGYNAVTRRVSAEAGEVLPVIRQALASLSPRAGEEGDQGLRASRDHAPRAGVALEKADPSRRDRDSLFQVAWEVQNLADFGGAADQSERDAMAAITQRALYLAERLQAIIDWADMALAMPHEFDSHGVRNLDGPVFDAAREFLSAVGWGAPSSATLNVGDKSRDEPSPKAPAKLEGES